MLRAGLALAALAVLSAQPAEAKWLKFKLSKGMEKTLGSQMLDAVKQDPGLVTKGADYDQVQRIGQALVEKNGLTEYDYQFHLVKDKDVNAFATAGGHVYVNQGLVEMMGYDESMLASVMAHELGHAKDRHVARGTEKMLQAQLGLGVISAFFGDGNKDLIDALGGVAGLASLKYSRDMEEWADRYGVELTYNAGYDAWGMVRGLQCLDALYGSAGDVGEWMQNHPSTDNRVARTSEIALSACGKAQGYRPIPVPPKKHVLYKVYGPEGSFYRSPDGAETSAGETEQGGAGIGNPQRFRR